MKKECIAFIKKSKIKNMNYTLFIITIIGSLLASIGYYTYNNNLVLASKFLSSILLPFFILIINNKLTISNYIYSLITLIILIIICFVVGFIFSYFFKMNCNNDNDIINNTQCRAFDNYDKNNIKYKNYYFLNLITGILTGILFIYVIHNGIYLNNYFNLEAIILLIAINLSLLILPEIVKSGMLYQMSILYNNDKLLNESKLSIELVSINIIGFLIGSIIFSYIYKC